jgi:hypothetical protein
MTSQSDLQSGLDSLAYPCIADANMNRVDFYLSSTEDYTFGSPRACRVVEEGVYEKIRYVIVEISPPIPAGTYGWSWTPTTRLALSARRGPDRFWAEDFLPCEVAIYPIRYWDSSAGGEEKVFTLGGPSTGEVTRRKPN